MTELTDQTREIAQLLRRNLINSLQFWNENLFNCIPSRRLVVIKCFILVSFESTYEFENCISE